MVRLVLVLGFIFLGSVFGADTDFDEFNSIVEGADGTARTTAGVFGTWFIGLLPLVSLAVGIFGGAKYLKKQSNGQEENFGKELGYMFAGGFLGLMVSIVIVTAIGAGLMGQSTHAFTVLNNFWLTIFDIN